MSYSRVSVLLPEPPHNQNSPFIMENTNMYMYGRLALTIAVDGILFR